MTEGFEARMSQHRERERKRGLDPLSAALIEARRTYDGTVAADPGGAAAAKAAHDATVARLLCLGG